MSELTSATREYYAAKTREDAVRLLKECLSLIGLYTEMGSSRDRGFASIQMSPSDAARLRSELTNHAKSTWNMDPMEYTRQWFRL